MCVCESDLCMSAADLCLSDYAVGGVMIVVAVRRNGSHFSVCGLFRDDCVAVDFYYATQKYGNEFDCIGLGILHRWRRTRLRPVQDDP